MTVTGQYESSEMIEVDALITNRILDFHDALISRGQIRPIASGPVSLVERLSVTRGGVATDEIALNR